MPDITAIVDAICANRAHRLALATLVAVEGSSYRRPGARLLLCPDGTHLGSISGGCLESDLKERATRVAANGVGEVVTYDTTAENDLVWGVGLGCQGVVRIVVEPIGPEVPVWAETVRVNLQQRQPTELVVEYDGPGFAGTRLADPAGEPRCLGRFLQTVPAPPELLVFGAGDDARPLVRFATTLGWHVAVADARLAYATVERFPKARGVVVAPTGDQVARLGPGSDSYAVVMTHRYRDDLVLVRELLARDIAYLGVLGPRKRTDRLLADLARDGFAPDAAMLAKLHAPVGLDLGGDGPEAVALAIVAELQMRLSGRGGSHLKDRAGPIHG